MAWHRRGHIFQTCGRHPWNRSHAQLPVALPIGDETLRIYYGTRDAKNRTRPSYFDVSANNPDNVTYVHDAPLLDLGQPGTFDDCGVMPSWALHHNGRVYLYYIGWTVRNTVPYHNSIGLAVSHNGGHTFERYAEGPLFSPTPSEPYFTGTSCVLVEDGLWRNWYLSCTGWLSTHSGLEPRYHIKYAESEDGVSWRRDGRVAIDYESEDEGGIVKASVLRDSLGYHMWFAYRRAADYRDSPANSYRIGYASSQDGLQWSREDRTGGLDVAEHGWDAQMVTYPHVIDHAGRRLMFYNGNGFGRSGIGFAEWQP